MSRFAPADAIELFDPRLASFQCGRLIPALQPVPFEVLEDALKQWLRKVAAKSPARAGQRYGSIEQLLLDEAEPVRANFDQMKLHGMKSGECFDNAFALAQCGGAVKGGPWLYTEGYALMDGAAEPFHHAWLTGPDGQIEDPTWRPAIEHKRRTEPERYWKGDVVYLGLTIDADAHRKWNERTLYPNLLSVYDDEIEEVLQHGPGAWRGGC